MTKLEKISMLCLASRKSAFTDHFISICFEIDNFPIKEKKFIYISEIVYNESLNLISLFSDSNFIQVRYNKYKALSSIKIFYNLIQSLYTSKKLFIYGENPFHALLSLVLKIFNPKITIITKVADPKSHKGISLFNCIIFFVSKLILFCISKKIIIASKSIIVDSNIFLKLISQRKICEAHFGNLLSLKINEKNFVINPYKDRNYDLIFFGKNAKYKSLDKIYKILYLMQERGIKINVLLIGKNIIPNLSIKNITYIDKYVNDYEFCYYLNNSKIGMFLYSESSGSHVVQNINYFGGWAIVSRVGYLQDCIVENYNGNVVEKNDNEVKIVNIIINILHKMDINHIDPFVVKKISESIFDGNHFSNIIINN